ncbi:hypothetical protein K737_300669 [Holospora undulata HU1]|uniref:Uncharacterized protein n=2 Tax=Holospora TaxID=44747 RepID=A0A061JG99_9PROT|nr:hypothetical protein K737_300669 [Holospora undulata HU1]GAJ46318.1 hypothetical protein HE1_00647 [Holospora elegans E1]
MNLAHTTFFCEKMLSRIILIKIVNFCVEALTIVVQVQYS